MSFHVAAVLLQSCLATPKGQRHLDVVERPFRKRSIRYLRLKIPVGIISVWGPSL